MIASACARRRRPVAARLLAAVGLFLLPVSVGLASTGTSVRTGYTSANYLTDANRFYLALKRNLAASGKVVVLNANAYLALRPQTAGDPPYPGLVTSSAADGLLCENELTPSVEKFYETPPYVLGRYSTNERFRKAGRSLIVDAGPDTSASDPATVDANKIYALASYYLCCNAATFLSWPWREWNAAIARDVGDPYTSPRLQDSRYEVFSRKFTNALVLVRPNNRYNAETGDYVYLLPARMQALQADNTLGAPVTSVTLRRHQALILVKNPNFSRTAVVSAASPLTQLVGARRLFPHVLVYGVFGTLNDGTNNLITPEELAAARTRYDLTNTNNYLIGSTLRYVNFSDKQENYKTVPLHQEIAQYFDARGRDFANAFIYFERDVACAGNESYLDRATLEDKFTKVVQQQSGVTTDVTAQAFGCVREDIPATPEAPKTYDLAVAPAVGDYTAVGNFWRFGVINLNLLSPRATDQSLALEYYDASRGWLSLPLTTDGTAGFAASGQIVFTPPVTWGKCTLDGQALYWVRIVSQPLSGAGRTRHGRALGTADTSGLVLRSLTRTWANYHWDGVSALSSVKYAQSGGEPVLPGWSLASDTNNDGVIGTGEVAGPAASAGFRYLARVPSRYFGNRWVMNLADITYTAFAREQALGQAAGVDGVFVDNVWANIPDAWKGTKAYFIGTFGPPTASGAGLASGTAPLSMMVSATTAPGGISSILVSLSAPATVQATISNLAGRAVACLPAQQLTRGTSTLLWNGRAATGTRVPAGAYLVRVVAHQAEGSSHSCLTALRR